MAATVAPQPQAPRRGGGLLTLGWVLAAALPVVGLLSLLAHARLDPSWTNPRVHFALFLTVGLVASLLAAAAGEAARRRGDARVLLLSLAFLATGGFMVLHAVGTEGILFAGDHAGFKIAIPVGLLVASGFCVAAAFVDVRPSFAGVVVRRRRWLRGAVLGAMAVWTVWTVAELPPMPAAGDEGAKGDVLALLAALGTTVYATAAVRFWLVFRSRMSLLPAGVIACCVLLTEAMLGVAVTGERRWHASWWEWHGLIVLAYLVVGFAAWRQWRDERFRPLYLETTRERARDVTVLFGDLAGFTAFSERSSPAAVAAMLSALHASATPLLVHGFRGTIERLTGDGMLVSFNAHRDQPDHAVRAARAALALQQTSARLLGEHAGWPPLRVGVNTGDVVIREMGGDGFVAYELCGDAVNTGARLESQAPAGGVLIGAETRRRLPGAARVEPMGALRVKGKDDAVEAFVLLGLD
jgi:class 3 adenylate cyclase